MDNSINFFQPFWVMTSSTKMDCFLQKNHSFLCIFSAFKASFFGAFQRVSFHFQRDLFSQATYKAKEWLCVTKSSSWRIFHQLRQENWWILSSTKKRPENSNRLISRQSLSIPNFSRHWLKINIHSTNECQTLNMTTDPNC